MSSSTKDKLVVKPTKSFLIVEIKLISANRIIEKLMKIEKRKFLIQMKIMKEK